MAHTACRRGGSIYGGGSAPNRTTRTEAYDMCSSRSARWGKEKGIAPFCAQHPAGRSGKRGLSPFPLRTLLECFSFCGTARRSSQWPQLHTSAVLAKLQTGFHLVAAGRPVRHHGEREFQLLRGGSRRNSMLIDVCATHGLLSDTLRASFHGGSKSQLAGVPGASACSG